MSSENMPVPGPDEIPAPATAVDPTSPLAIMAATMREVFQSLVAAGFSDHQSCVILGTWFGITGQSGSQDSS